MIDHWKKKFDSNDSKGIYYSRSLSKHNVLYRLPTDLHTSLMVEMIYLLCEVDIEKGNTGMVTLSIDDHGDNMFKGKPAEYM